MSRRQIQFYATPLEQQMWLDEILQIPRLWCVARYAGRNEKHFELRPENVKSLNFLQKQENSLILYAGTHECSSPVWDVSPGHPDIDMLQSRAVQIVLSVVVEDDILLEGRAAIMSLPQYQLANVAPKPAVDLFRMLLRRLMAHATTAYVLKQDIGRGVTKKWPSVVLTPGAVEWKRAGHHLKQFPRGAVEFDVTARTKQGKE